MKKPKKDWKTIVNPLAEAIELLSIIQSAIGKESDLSEYKYSHNDVVDIIVETQTRDRETKMNFVNKHYPEKPVKCFAQAVTNGLLQAERKEALKELGLE